MKETYKCWMGRRWKIKVKQKINSNRDQMPNIIRIGIRFKCLDFAPDISLHCYLILKVSGSGYRAPLEAMVRGFKRR